MGSGFRVQGVQFQEEDSGFRGQGLGWGVLAREGGEGAHPPFFSSSSFSFFFSFLTASRLAAGWGSTTQSVNCSVACGTTGVIMLVVHVWQRTARARASVLKSSKNGVRILGSRNAGA